MGWLNTLLFLLLPAVVLLYVYIRRKFSYWADRNVPHVPGRLPMGSLKGMGRTRHATQLVDDIYRQFKETAGAGAVGLYMLVKPVLLVCDLDLVKQILVKDFNSFHDRGMYVNVRDDPLSGHLFSIEGERWRFLRNKLSPTFTSGKIKSMFLTIREIGDEFVHSFDKYVEGKMPADAKALAQRFTCDVIGSCAFGLECNSLKNEGSKLLTIGDQIFKPKFMQMMKIFFTLSFGDLSRKLRLIQTPADVTAFFMDVVRSAVDYREKNSVMRPDFLQLLIQLKNKGTVEDGADESFDKLTMDEVAAQAFLFFFAGFETSSTALSFALFELANNSDIQERTREEVRRVLAAHGGHITYEALREMAYVEQVVNETLRRYPPLGNLMRVANQPHHISSPDVTIEKGTMVMIPVYAIHHDPEIYPDPFRFDPDRFTAEAIGARHTHSFLPFGDGPRNCIGMRFALLEVKFAIAQLLSRLRFTVNERTTVPLEIDPKASLLDTIGGVWLDVEKI